MKKLMFVKALSRQKFLIFKRFWSLFLFILIVTAVNSLEAQENNGYVFYFENRVADAFASFQSIAARPHFLGDEMGRKYSVFHDLYSYTHPGNILHTGQQVVVSKPTIFNSVKKTNRYYRRLFRREEITEEEAIKKVNHLLDVAISVYTQSTDALEDELRKTRKQNEIAKIFENIVLR